MVKCAAVLKLGTADTEDILRRFRRPKVQNPIYKALAELGRDAKTIFLCRYLHSLELHREIHEGSHGDRRLSRCTQIAKNALLGPDTSPKLRNLRRVCTQIADRVVWN
jgi:hypothetical protein